MAKNWLLSGQDSQGGWGAHLGDEASTLNTPEVIIALLDGGVSPGNEPIKSGIKFLTKHQITEEPDLGAWPREFDGAAHKVPDIVRTSFALPAFIKAGEGIDKESVQNGVNWVIQAKKENENGEYKGWAYRREGAIDLMPTCFALLAMLQAYGAGGEEYKKSL